MAIEVLTAQGMYSRYQYVADTSAPTWSIVIAEKARQEQLKSHLTYPRRRGEAPIDTISIYRKF